MNPLKWLLSCVTLLITQLSVHATVTLTSTVTNNKCYNGTTGSITGTASGGSSGQFEYRLATGPAAGWQSSNTFTALAAGTYPLSARDKNNTNDIATIFVTVGQPTAIAVSANVTNTSCSASSDGIVALTVSGGTSPYSYTWTKNGTSMTGITTSSITGLTPGVYNAIVTDANGCQQQLTNASSTAIVPLSLTGFNEDVIANGTNTSTTTNSTVTSPMDFVNTNSSGTITFAGSNLYVAGFKTTSGSTAFTGNSLPANGSLTSAKDQTHQFVFANYNASNDLYLNGNGASGAIASGTLTLANGSVAPYQSLFILANSGNGTSTVGYTIKYTDNTTAAGSFAITDWASGTANIALDTLSRVFYKQTSTTNRFGTTTYVNAGTLDGQGDIFKLYDLPISIPTNTKNISSITFYDSTNTQANIFAITGSTSSVGVAVAAGSASSVTPSVAISTNPSNLTYCSGENFTFIANPTNAGGSPTYTWTVAGITQSSTSNTMTAAISGTGSKNIVVTLTVTDASATCLTSQTVSQTITLNSGAIAPSVSVSGPASICQGSSTTYIATPTNGGITPTYAWYVNGNLVSGATDATFTNTLTNTGANSVYAKLTSSVSCATPNPATSTTVSTTVNTNVTPSATITAKSVKSGANTNVTFSISSSANLGSSPSYQWYLNGNPISGATSSNYTVVNPLSTDSYSVAVVSSATCPTSAQIMSNYVSVNTALPIIMDWFKATLQNSNNAILSWHTTSESNVKIIEIERSQNSTDNFTTIGAVLPTNNPAGATYSYVDTLGAVGNYFYRLKTIDLDGTSTYSDIVSVAVNKGISTSVMTYPNPFSDELHVQISSSQNIQNASFTLYTITGQAIAKIVKNINIGSQIIDFQNISNLPSGIYMLKLDGAGIENNAIKIIKR